ncbi:MAG: glucose-6-phosphate dehydrogenase [Reyranella sp.]|uniref:glucose-6-phosphate dehydrogenase n=1 Tax=Reyranella sp. TaxID=1929291 RepID=UPI001AC7091C|nr:glucose-6-phosphate dehydrogenase [Reyranella sp.]MBN9090841.1 glucose-6-phosphate dehydrogenase [Reyranella sp.]
MNLPTANPAETTPDSAPPPPTCTLVIFGATGDLTRRLLVPALRNLRRNGLLPDDFALIGVASRDIGDDGFREHLRKGMEQFGGGARDDIDWFLQRTRYVSGKFEGPEPYKAVAALLPAERNALFYLATPPTEFQVIARRLGKADLLREGENTFRRLVIEKPFGHDLPSAAALDKRLLRVAHEDQIFRIDHYLGKETVQNILVLRFANGFVEPLWNRDHIDHVQITVAETVGVEGRGKSYNGTGALRDMVPNHLFQLLSLIAMEPPSHLSAGALRAEKAKVLHAVRNLDPRLDVVRAQYGAGRVGDAAVPAYRGEPDVPTDSSSETYVAMKLGIDNWRWVGVPFYLRTGKRLGRRRTEITVQFRQAPLALFRDTPVERLPPNDLTLHIQPEEGVQLRFGVKIPGPTVRIDGADMKFNYSDVFEAKPSTGYETLIYDCMMGDASLFQPAETIEAGWGVIQPILDAWENDRDIPLAIYDAGGMGPKEADELLARDHRRWRRIIR